MAQPAAWPSGGGETGALIRARDWSATPLGDAPRWPHALRTVVEIMLGAPTPVAVVWGPSHVLLYNDAYLDVARDRHPGIFGGPALEGWADAREFLEPILSGVLAGGPAVVVDDHTLPLRGPAGVEPRTFRATFSAIPGDDGTVGGIFHPLHETTAAARVRQALRESDDRLRLALDAAGLGIWEHDVAGGAFHLDTRAQTLFGLGERVPDGAVMERVHPGDRERLGGEWAAAMDPAARGPVHTEYRVVRPGGAVRWLRVRGRVHFGEGRPLRGVGTVQDVTDEKEAAGELRRTEARQAFLLELSDRLRPLHDPADIQYHAAAALGEHLGASRVGYAEAQDDGESVVVTHSYTRGVPGVEGRYRFDDYDPAVLQAFREGRTVARPDVAGDPSLSSAEKARHAALRVGATVNVPLLKAGRLEAVLFMHHTGPRDWSPDELALLEAVAERTWDAVERARAEAALRENEQRLRLALDVAELGTWGWDLATGTGELDARGAHIVGLTPGIVPDIARAQRASIHPDDLARVEADAAAGLASGHAFDLLYRAVHPDGGVHYVASRAIAIRGDDGVPARLVGTNRDVTEQVVAQRQLEAARDRAERLQALTAALAGARTVDDVATVVVADMVGALGARTGALAVRAPEGDALVVLRTVGFPQPLDPGVRRQPLDGLTPLAECYAAQRAVWVERRDGPAGLDARYPSIAPVWDVLGVQSGAFVPLAAAGEPVGAISFGYAEARVFTPEERAFLRALGQQAALAVERARLFEAEHAARAEAERANRAKSEFLAVMSHELRTPLNAIGGYAELMEMGIRGPITPQQREDLRRVQTSQRHLLGLINEVLNYARLETGTVHYDVADVRMREVVAAAEMLVAPQAQARELALEVAPCPPELTVRADADKVRQILVNLLSNAVKFTDRGGRVELLCDDEGERVRVRVRDTGIGISADQMERIFEPFVQVRADLTRTAEGTGLGLAISRDLARGMSGDLTAESTPGAGSTFTLTLPRA